MTTFDQLKTLFENAKSGDSLALIAFVIARKAKTTYVGPEENNFRFESQIFLERAAPGWWK